MFELCGETSRGVSLTRVWQCNWYCFISCIHQVLSLAYLVITGDCCIYNYMQWDILIMKACESVSQTYKHHTGTISSIKTEDRGQTALIQSKLRRCRHVLKGKYWQNNLWTKYIYCVFIFREIRFRFKWLPCKSIVERFREVYNGSWLGAEPFIEEAFWNTEHCANSHWNISK